MPHFALAGRADPGAPAWGTLEEHAMFATRIGQNVISGATRHSLQSSCSRFEQLSQLAMEGLDRLSYLNLQAAKAGVVEATLAARHMMAARGAQDWVMAACAGIQPVVEQAAAYSRNSAQILASAQAGLAQLAQAQLCEAHGQTGLLLNEAARQVPDWPGSSLWRLALEQAGFHCRQLSDAARQAAGVLEGRVGVGFAPVFCAAWQVENGDPTADFSYAAASRSPRRLQG